MDIEFCQVSFKKSKEMFTSKGLNFLVRAINSDELY